MTFELVLGSKGQRILYESGPGEMQSEPRVFRVKSNIKDIAVKDEAGRTINTFQETNDSEISIITVSEAIAEIRHYTPDLSGYEESDLRDALQGKEHFEATDGK